MSSIYIHIPFCHSKCYYCGFHSVASCKDQYKMVDAICKELILRSDFLNGKTIETIYFGGGTPSILKIEEIEKILNQIKSIHTIVDNPEISLEANPEDLNRDFLIGIKNIGINRLSIGIQSLNDDILKFINRRHTAKEAIEAVCLAKEIGFDNISIDLIYGIPNQDNSIWEENLRKIESLPISHLSSYCLSIDDNTVFSKKEERGEFSQMPEEESEMQYRMLVEWTKKNGFEHYEISNFCRDGLISRHNTAYWQDKPYLGIGPAAHSYNIETRQWNCSNNPKYIKAIESGHLANEVEERDLDVQFNEYLMTSLRTKWGINLKEMEERFPKAWLEHLSKKIIKFKLHLNTSDNKVSIKEESLFISDEIIAEFFI